MTRSFLFARPARLLAGGLVAGLCLAGTAPAQTTRPARVPPPQEVAKPEDTVRKHYGVRWHSTLDGALEAAREKSKPKAPRPVLWLRMLGDLAGKT